MPLLDDAVGQQRQSYLLLFGAVGCVLLIACANIANLVLARFAGRRREIAARFALGATRFDVIRQLVTESMLLAVLGGAVGLLLAQWALATLVAFGADFIPRAIEIRIDPLALGFALAVSLVTGLAIGLLPAWQAASVNVQEALKEAGRGSVGSGGRLRSGLLVAEVSLSLVLLIAVGLLLTSFARLQQVKPGFEPAGVFTAQLALPPTRYDRQKLVVFYEQLYQRLSTLPGSTSAALTDRVPLTGGQTPAPVAIGGRPLPPLSERPQANRHLVSPRYFATLGIPILAGRDFDERDSSRVPHVVIVNETFARRHFPGENPIGRTLVTGMAQLPSQIVGVVADVRSTSSERAAGRGLLPAGTAAAGSLHEHPRADERQPCGDAAGRARGAAIGGPGSPAAATAAALRARRADGRRSQTRADAAGGIRGPGARAREPRRVQRDGASRDLPHERDRPSHGAWRITGRRDADGAWSWPPADAYRDRRRDRRRARGVAAAAADALRGRRDQPGDLPRAVGLSAARHRVRVVVPGAARDEDRSGDRTPGRVTQDRARAAATSACVAQFVAAAGMN